MSTVRKAATGSLVALLVIALLAPVVLASGTTWAVETGWAQVPYIVASITEPVLPDQEYDIRDYGAVGDGVTDARPAIQQAINEANAAGGGRIILPPGTWFSKGPIHLKSNIELHVSEGATLLFSEDPADYLPVVLTRWECTEVYNYSPLIYTYQATNVAITGKGLIDGNAENGFGTWRPLQSEDQLALREMGGSGVPVCERVFGEGHYLRPSMIQFFGAKNVLVEDVTIIDSPFWVVHLVFTNNAIVRGITVDSHRLNNDGVDIDSSVNVLVDGNTFDTGDDSIVIKSGRDQDGWRIGQPSENIVIRNNKMTGHNALAIGSEMSGGVRNVFMEDNDLVDVRSAIYFKGNLDRGGVIENVWVRDIHVKEADTLLRYQTNYHGERGGFYPPLYRNFVIENVTAQKVDRAIEAVGIEGYPIENIFVRNMVVEEAAEPMVIENARSIVLENVWINGEQMPTYPAGTE